MIPSTGTGWESERAWRSVSSCNHERTPAGAASFHEHQLAHGRSAHRRPAIVDRALGRARDHAAFAFAWVFGGERVAAGIRPARRSLGAWRPRRLVTR